MVYVVANDVVGIDLYNKSLSIFHIEEELVADIKYRFRTCFDLSEMKNIKFLYGKLRT